MLDGENIYVLSAQVELSTYDPTAPASHTEEGCRVADSGYTFSHREQVAVQKQSPDWLAIHPSSIFYPWSGRGGSSLSKGPHFPFPGLISQL